MILETVLVFISSLDTISVLVLLCLVIYLYLYLVNKHVDKLPAAPGLPILKNALDFIDIPAGLLKINNHLMTCGKIIRIYIGPVLPSILTCDPKLVDFLIRFNKDVTKPKFYKFLHGWLGTGLVTSDGEKWKLRRKALTRFFTQKSYLENYLEVFEQQSDILVNILKETIELDSVNLHPIMKRFTLDVICETALGVQMNIQRNNWNRYAEAVEVIGEVVTPRSVSLFKRYDFIYRLTNDYKREHKAIKVLDEFFDKVLAETSRRQYSCDKSFIYSLLTLEIGGTKMSKNDIREELNTVIFGGYETTATTMSFALYELSRHPEIQEKLFQEQKEIFGESNDLKSVHPKYDDLQKMNYLECVIKETLRLYPPLPFLGRKIGRDLHYGDILFPKNINIVISVYTTHLHKDHFKNPEKFCPERFQEDTIIPNSFIPFGFGPRVCVGNKYGILELRCSLSKIIRNYKILPVQHEIKLTTKVTLTSVTGMRVKFQERND